MKPPLRIKSVSTKVFEEEFVAMESRARARKLTLSEWVRAELLEPRADGGGAADEVLPFCTSTMPSASSRLSTTTACPRLSLLVQPVS